MSQRNVASNSNIRQIRNIRKAEEIYANYYIWGHGKKKKAEALPRVESMTSLCYRSIATYVNEDNLQGLQLFLENKQVQVDDKDENGTTSLMLASSKGRIAFVCELLAHGANPNVEDDDAWSALLCAAKEGYTDVCHELLEHGANIDHRDMGGWTALMWATYKGRADVVLLLLDRGADVNAHGNYHISSLLWAAGRGYTNIVQSLVSHGCKVNVGDKYGTTALVWACRKGYVDIVDCLLRAGANVDTTGMYSWTALLVATQGNHLDVVHLLLDFKPNVNALDKDGCSALTIACKEGYYEIASALMSAGAYINVQDRAGDTNLIHAVKGGHRGVVETLLKKYADVDVTGKDRKTALYMAVEKSNVPIVKMLLGANPDLEMATKDGDTPLLKAVRSRNSEIVQLLLDKKAKVSAADKKGDTALHIAMRARSKTIVEILLRNPKHSQLLYRPNRAGETPYNIDMNNPKTILGQIFGARRLNTNEDNENMLGYDLYSSALADILSEPSLSMPITVGLYAKWGSGKSFLLNKLREEMKNFARQWLDPTFQFTTLLFVLILHLGIIIGTIVGVSILNWTVGLSVLAFVVIISYSFLALLWFLNKKYDWDWCYSFIVKLTRKMNSLKLILQIMFCHSPGNTREDGVSVQPIKFYFTDQTRVSSTIAGENSIVQMVGSLYDAIENDYGSVATRLYRAFKPKPVKSTTWKWRKLCCLPNIAIFEITLACLLTGTCALTAFLLRSKSYQDNTSTEIERLTLNIIMIGSALPLVLVTIANLYTWNKMCVSLFFSQRKHLQRSIAKLDSLKSEGFFQALRTEVNLMKDMVKCLDSLSSQQTRLVIIVDGLDSCEQDKVLLVLDAVHVLFSDSNNPFIVLLAIDPHVIAKAVEMNSRRLFSDSNIDGHSYLNNMVHLPFYLQNSGLRKVKIAQQTSAQSHRKLLAGAAYDIDEVGGNILGRSLSSRRLSTESTLMSSTEKLKFNARKGSKKLKLSESVASSIGSNLNRIGGAQDLTKMLLTDDYFSDVNPKSMRRLMNVVYVTGRLLKSFQIDFNWYRLASWINITEQWPFRTSWIIYHYDMFEDNLEDSSSLKSIYEKVRPHIPNLKDVEPLLELDRDEKKFDIFLSYHRSSLLVSDLKIFLPFTINLDPYLKKVIKEETQVIEDDEMIMMTPGRNSYMSHTHMPHNNVSWGGIPDWASPPSNTGVRNPKLLTRQSSLGIPTTSLVYPTNAGMVNWPQNWGDLTSQQYNLGPVTEFSAEMLETKLSTLTVDGISKLLNSIDEIEPATAAKYKKVIHENNINGRVLLHCDMDELKKLLSMSFGDWEMFRVLIVSMRGHELTTVLKKKETKSKNVGNVVKTTNLGSHSRERKASLTKMALGSSDKEKMQLDGNVGVIKNKQNVIEKQITLEDQMICGALQTLNEEACEDVIEEVEDPKYSDNSMIPRTSIIPPSPDGTQDIINAPSFNDIPSCETDYVILKSSPVGNMHWQPISISSRGNAESLSDNSSLGSSQPPSPVGQRQHKFTLNFTKTRKDSDTKFAPLKKDGSEKSLLRPNSLSLLKDSRDANKIRSKSIDHTQMEAKSSSSLGMLSKIKGKLLHSDPHLNDFNSESVPLVPQTGAYATSTSKISMRSSSNDQEQSDLYSGKRSLKCKTKSECENFANPYILDTDPRIYDNSLGSSFSHSCGHLYAHGDQLDSLELEENVTDVHYEPETRV